MTKLEKLLERLRRDPGSGRFRELDRLLRAAGARVRHGKGDHSVYSIGGQTIILPYRRAQMSVAYVRQVIAALDQVRGFTNDDED
jgi:hypothetical protein